MNTTTLPYKKKVWEFLEKMEPCRMYSVTKLAKPETRKYFIDAVKEYMRSLPYQGWISFNHDYSKLYKSHPAVKHPGG